MSRRLQDLFWDLDLTGTEQVVAQRLAWHANDEDGRCWPGIASLSDKTGLSARAVQNAIKSLATAGHLTRYERAGVGVVYVIHPRTTCTPPAGDNDARATPADAAPRTICAPAGGAETPAAGAPKQVKNPSDPNGGAGERADDLELVEKITGQRGRRIAVDWQPTLPLPDTIAKVVDGWPPGRLDELLDEFRDFWIADAGQRASKRDWDRTWWNRIRAVIDRDKHLERRGGRAGRGDDRGGLRNPMAAAAARAVAGGNG